MNQIQDYRSKCNECGKTSEVASKGFVVCIFCGVTKERTYSDTYPVYSNDLRNQKIHNSIGKNVNFVGALGSQIGYSSGFLKGARGNELNFRTVLRYRRLIKHHHQRSFVEGNATHLRTMISFTRIVNFMGLSNNVKSRSLHLYWKYVNYGKKITNHILLVALCLLQSVRETSSNAPVRFSEIISAFSNNNHRVTNKNILRLARELGISLSPLRRKPEDYLNRIANHVVNHIEVKNRLIKRNLSVDQYEAMLIIVSRKILEKLSIKERGGVQPYPFAVSIMYLADRAFNKAVKKKSILTQKLLADSASSAEFTIRDHGYRCLGQLYKNHEAQIMDEVQNHIEKRNSKK